jgi:hypothetical protein
VREEGGGGWGGEGGAKLHILFLNTRGEITLCWVRGGRGGGCPSYLETFVFIGIVLLNRDFILKSKLK